MVAHAYPHTLELRWDLNQLTTKLVGIDNRQCYCVRENYMLNVLLIKSLILVYQPTLLWISRLTIIIVYIKTVIVKFRVL